MCDIRHMARGKMVYALRSQTIERIFGDAKEKHQMRYTQLRGRARLKMQVLLTFSCMNLKKLARWKWKAGMVEADFLWVVLGFGKYGKRGQIVTAI